MREHLRHNVVGYVAVFLALTATATALPGRNTVNSGDIINGEVKRRDLATSSVSSRKVAADSLTGADIDEATLQGLPATGPAGGDLTGNYPNPQIGAGTVGAAELGANAVNSTKVRNESLGALDIADTNTLGGAEINEGALTAGGDLNGSLGGAQIDAGAIGTTEVAANSLTGADINESTLSVASLGCQPGKVQGYALIHGDPGMPSAFTSSASWISDTFNCSGDPVRVRRDGTGEYSVIFDGISANLALATVQDVISGRQCEDNYAAALPSQVTTVWSFDDDGDAQDCWVALVVF